MINPPKMTFLGSAVKVFNGDIDSAINVFKHRLRKDGWYVEKEKRLCYTKPSQVIRNKEKARILKTRRQ